VHLELLDYFCYFWLFLFYLFVLLDWIGFELVLAQTIDLDADIELIIG
jgi:hypothetical protein